MRIITDFHHTDTTMVLSRSRDCFQWIHQTENSHWKPRSGSIIRRPDWFTNTRGIDYPVLPGIIQPGYGSGENRLQSPGQLPDETVVNKSCLDLAKHNKAVINPYICVKQSSEYSNEDSVNTR